MPKANPDVRESSLDSTDIGETSTLLEQLSAPRTSFTREGSRPVGEAASCSGASARGVNTHAAQSFSAIALSGIAHGDCASPSAVVLRGGVRSSAEARRQAGEGSRAQNGAGAPSFSGSLATSTTPQPQPQPQPTTRTASKTGGKDDDAGSVPRLPPAAVRPLRSAMRSMRRPEAGPGGDIRAQRNISWRDFHANQDLVVVHPYEPSEDNYSDDDHRHPECCVVC